MKEILKTYDSKLRLGVKQQRNHQNNFENGAVGHSAAKIHKPKKIVPWLNLGFFFIFHHKNT